MPLPCFNDDVTGEEWDQVKNFFKLKCEIWNFVPWVRISCKNINYNRNNRSCLKKCVAGG